MVSINLLAQSQRNLVNRHTLGSKTSKFGHVTVLSFIVFKNEKIQLQQRACLKPAIFYKRRLLYWTGLNLISFSVLNKSMLNNSVRKITDKKSLTIFAGTAVTNITSLKCYCLQRIVSSVLRFCPGCLEQKVHSVKFLLSFC